MNRTFALFLSYLFHPLALITVGAVFIFQLDSMYYFRFGLKANIFFCGLIFFNTFLIPVFIMRFLKRSGRIGSMFMETMEERRLPLMLTSLCLLVTFYFFTSNANISMPYLFNGYLLGVTTSMIAAALITFFYKISLHAIGMGGLTALLVLLQPNAIVDLRLIIALWIFCSALVGVARLFLLSHNPMQVYTGFLLGFLSVYFIMQI